MVEKSDSNIKYNVRLLTTKKYIFLEKENFQNVVEISHDGLSIINLQKMKINF